MDIRQIIVSRVVNEIREEVRRGNRLAIISIIVSGPALVISLFALLIALK